MTGPGPGKIPLEDAEVYLITDRGSIRLDNAVVYIHLKGYSRARVTHLDIEYPNLENLLSSGGGYLEIYNVSDMIRIKLRRNCRLSIQGRLVRVYGLVVKHSAFRDLIEDRSYIVTWVGSKHDGIYIGFKREIIKKLEEIAFKISNLTPR